MQFLFSGLDPLGLLQSRVTLGEILFETGMRLSSISGSYPANLKLRYNDKKNFSLLKP